MPRATSQNNQDPIRINFCPYCGGNKLKCGNWKIYQCRECRISFCMLFSRQLRKAPKKQIETPEMKDFTG